jgi:hypothetical protein
LVLLIDLVVLIMTYLNGEITTRFILKALAVLLAVGTTVYYYIRDAQGYWLTHQKQAKLFALVACGMTVLTLTVGFFNIELPNEVREQKIDENQITDLRELQWQITNFYLTNEELPKTISDLSRGNQFVAPEGRSSYRYELRDNGFALCAEFSSDSTDKYGNQYPTRLDGEATIINPDDWYHEAGDWCFERIVQND